MSLNKMRTTEVINNSLFTILFLLVDTACRKDHESAYHLIHFPYLPDNLSTGDSLLKVYRESKQSRSLH